MGWIKRFPKNTSIWIKLLVNLIVPPTLIKLTKKNLLNAKEYRKARMILRRGDVIVVGQEQDVSSYLLKSEISHSLLYVGLNKLVHAPVYGVQTISFKKLFKVYDRLIILRPKATKRKIRKAIRFVKEQVGKPYNFYLTDRDDSFYCSQLITHAFARAKYDVGVQSPNKTSWYDSIIYPEYLLEGNFSIVYSSIEKLKLPKSTARKAAPN